MRSDLRKRHPRRVDQRKFRKIPFTVSLPFRDGRTSRLNISRLEILTENG
jgi:hypothetical protein